jgi:hypothetical protein
MAADVAMWKRWVNSLPSRHPGINNLTIDKKVVALATLHMFPSEQAVRNNGGYNALQKRAQVTRLFLKRPDVDKCLSLLTNKSDSPQPRPVTVSVSEKGKLTCTINS